MVLTITHEEVLKAVKNYVENSGAFDVNKVDIKVRRGSKVEALVELNIQNEEAEPNEYSKMFGDDTENISHAPIGK